MFTRVDIVLAEQSVNGTVNNGLPIYLESRTSKGVTQFRSVGPAGANHGCPVRAGELYWIDKAVNTSQISSPLRICGCSCRTMPAQQAQTNAGRGESETGGVGCPCNFSKEKTSILTFNSHDSRPPSRPSPCSLLSNFWSANSSATKATKMLRRLASQEVVSFLDT